VSDAEASDIRYRIMDLPNGGEPVAAEPPKARLPLPTMDGDCASRGRPAPPPPGGSVSKTWYHCDAGYGVVCRCNCGPACPGYAAESPYEPPEEPTAVAPGKVTLTVSAGGIGDGVQGLLVVAGFRREHPGTHLTYRPGPRAVPFVELFTGYDALVPHNQPPTDGSAVRELNVGYGIEQNNKCRVPRVLRYAKNAGIRNARLPVLRDPAAVWEAGADFRGAVAICPFSYGWDREYSVPGWLAVERILRDAGHRTVVLHSRGERTWTFRSEKVIAGSPLRVAGVLRNAAAVVGVDSGMSHLAAALGTPTVVLEGPTNVANIFLGYANATTVDGRLPCRGCHWHAPHHKDHCSPRCPSIQGIPPEQVAAAIEAAALLPPAGLERTLFGPKKLAVLRDAVKGTVGLPGDVAELGVFRGGTAALLGRYAYDCRLRLFDTFEGLPADCPDGVHRAGEFAAGEADVVGFLKAQRLDPVVYRGVFPATAPAGVKYRFVHVDGDLYSTTKAAIAYFGPRMVPGGAMMFDDVDWKDTPGVTRAVEEAFPGQAERVGENQAVVRF
jgi:ADP-heptose:LPS heptosyltransferase